MTHSFYIFNKSANKHLQVIKAISVNTEKVLSLYCIIFFGDDAKIINYG